MVTGGTANIIFLCVLHLLSLLIFMKGFFPIKSSRSLVSSDNTSSLFDDLSDVVEEEKSLKAPVIGRVVLVVVDGLRADFVFSLPASEHLPYLNEMVKDKNALGFLSKAHPPTVTLPRLKALTTGTVPGFVDVIFNLGSVELDEDNLIAQATRKGLKIAFYGDDTWIKLFPKHFIRCEGTTSFFVTDFTEVDANVTRHLDAELSNEDWDILILHYLGLDHIGHVAGPRSPLVGPKLSEMDHAIRYIYETLNERASKLNGMKRPPLVVVCGDHGMSDAGSHGGASAAEINVPMVLLSPLFKQNIESIDLRESIMQIDLVPTLSLLLGLPIPENNIGKLIYPIFSSLDDKQQLYFAYMNAYQLSVIGMQYVSVSSVSLKFEEAKRQHVEWLKNLCFLSNKTSERCSSFQDLMSSYRDIMEEYGQLVSAKATDYDTSLMILAIILQWSTLAYVVLDAFLGRLAINKSLNPFGTSFITLGTAVVVLNVVTALTGLWTVHVTALTLAVFTTALVWRKTMLLRKGFQVSTMTAAPVQYAWLSTCLISFLLLHSISLASSSFVEEEHQTWYFLTKTTYLLMVMATFRKRTCLSTAAGSRYRPGPLIPFVKEISDCKSARMETWIRICVLLVMLRVGQSWNSTGDKWAHLPDIGDWLNEHKIVLCVLFVGGLTSGVVIRGRHHNLFSRILLITISSFIYTYRAASGCCYLPLTILEYRYLFPQMASITYFLISAILVPSMYYKTQRKDQFLQSIVTSWVFLMLLLSRPHNVPLVAIMVGMENVFSKLVVDGRLPAEVVALLSVFLSWCSFFQLGNANSLARIDLAGGYVGLTEYNPVLVGILLTCGTYAGPIFWQLSMCASVYRQDPPRFSENLLLCCLLLLFCRILPWAFYSVITFVQRYHLFVWTVFSPKLLYEGASSAITILVSTFYLQITSR